MGTSITNVSQHIVKFKVSPDVGHRAEWYRDEAREVVHEELHPDELAEQQLLPNTLMQLNDETFEKFVLSADLVLVAFGAPWCPWSQRLEPVWRKTWDALKAKPYVTRPNCSLCRIYASCGDVVAGTRSGCGWAGSTARRPSRTPRARSTTSTPSRRSAYTGA